MTAIGFSSVASMPNDSRRDADIKPGVGEDRALPPASRPAFPKPELAQSPLA